MPKINDPCNQNACDIQTCLKKNDYMMERCRKVILDLQQCCEECQNRSRHCGELSGLIANIRKKSSSTMPKSTDPCNQHACYIQACLKKNSYMMERCRKEILDLQKCCEEWNNQSKHCAALSGLIAEISKIKPK